MVHVDEGFTMEREINPCYQIGKEYCSTLAEGWLQLMSCENLIINFIEGFVIYPLSRYGSYGS